MEVLIFMGAVMINGIYLLVIFTLSTVAIASEDFAGRLIRKVGKVEVFINPASKVTGAGPHVKFDGLYYTIVTDPKLGYKIPNGSVIRTDVNSKVRIVYSNGDQFSVGEATSYKVVSRITKSSGSGTVINLFFGKLRAVISKEGPRKNMKIKTNTAVMGIRGTDFFVDKKSSLKGAEVKVLRGVVELKPENKKVKAVKIASGFSGKAPPLKVKSEAKLKGKKEIIIEAAVVVQRTSKQELVEIQNQSVIKKEEMKQEKIDQKIAQELEKLEKKAVENTLKDIKRYDPEMYNKLKDEKLANIDQINTDVVKKVFEKAPDRPLKPGLDNLGDHTDVYDKYFSIE